MKQLLCCAQECLDDSDRAQHQAAWRDIAIASALDKAIEAVTLVCRAILITTGLAEIECASAIPRLAKRFEPIRRELDTLHIRWQAEDVVNLAHVKIDSFTPIDESGAQSKIGSARHFVQSWCILLTSILPHLARRGLQGWDVIPPEDPAGGALR